MVLEEISQELPNSTIPEVLQLAATFRFLATGSFQNIIGKHEEIAFV